LVVKPDPETQERNKLISTVLFDEESLAYETYGYWSAFVYTTNIYQKLKKRRKPWDGMRMLRCSVVTAIQNETMGMTRR
jgi:hypothetical protein